MAEQIKDELEGSELPQGWGSASLLELAGLHGVVNDGDWVESKDQDPLGEVRLIQLADVGDGVFVNRSNRFMNASVAERLNCTYLQKGDVLIARMPSPLGRACIFPGLDQAAVTVVDVLVWRRDESLCGADPEWLMYIINSPPIRTAIASQAGGTTRQRIAGAKLKQLLLPTPPLEEQRRIASKVQFFFKQTRRARAALDQVPDLLKMFCNLTLELGVSGKLVTGTRNADGSKRAKQVQLRDVASGFDYGTSSKSQRHGDVPVLRMGNIQNGALQWTDLAYTSNDEEISKYLLADGDVLFNRTNSPELVGKSAVFRSPKRAIFAGYLIRVRCNEELSPEYLTYCLNGPSGRAYAQKVKSDGVSQSNINATKLAAFKFALPSLEEQHIIVARITAALDWADRVAKECAKASRLISELEANVLLKAFRGEIAEQRSHDEPITAVLEQIREQIKTAPKPAPAPRAEKRANSMTFSETLSKDIESWPVGGLTFEELYARLEIPYDEVRDAIFKLLTGPGASLNQVFDEKVAQMRLMRAKN